VAIGSTMWCAIEEVLADEAITETARHISDRLRNQDPVGKACHILTETVSRRPISTVLAPAPPRSSGDR
jgi:hypothetical protein